MNDFDIEIMAHAENSTENEVGKKVLNNIAREIMKFNLAFGKHPKTLYIGREELVALMAMPTNKYFCSDAGTRQIWGIPFVAVYAEYHIGAGI